MQCRTSFGTYKIFFAGWTYVGKSQVKSHPNIDTGIRFSMQNHIYKGSQKGFLRLPSKKRGWRDEFFHVAKIFLRLTLCWKKSQVKSGPQKSPNLTICRVSHSSFDTGIQFSTQNHIYKLSRKGFFGFLHKKCLAGQIFSEGGKIFLRLTLCGLNV